MTLGQSIGRIKHTFNVTNARDQKASVTVTFDFTSASDNDVKSWLVSNRVIAMQRPIRALTLGELGELDGMVIVAQHAGRKVQSREQRRNELMAAGIPEKLADYGASHPEKFDAIMAKYQEAMIEELEEEKDE